MKYNAYVFKAELFFVIMSCGFYFLSQSLEVFEVVQFKEKFNSLEIVNEQILKKKYFFKSKVLNKEL